MSALVVPADMDVLGPPPALSSSPLLGAEFLSELQCAPWRPPPACAPSAAAAAAAAAAVDALTDQMARLTRAAPRPILASQHRERRRCKKRVAFADDKGLALVQVIERADEEFVNENSPTRVVADTDGLPLGWSLELTPPRLPQLPQPPQRPRWSLAGGQPVAEFSRFCQRLDRDSVALETAVCGAGRRTITGIIRVKNLGFEKRVFVRATNDGWRSSRDWSAIYIAPVHGAVGPAPSYDRFSFEVETPEVGSGAERIEFCVCFQCAAGEFWDNNGGGNYVALRESLPDQPPGSPPPRWEPEAPAPRPPPRDVFRAKVESSWAYFSSWGSVTAEVPYW
ncbi:protein phosphatase 1 regulatory subunit 3C-like isoform X1 [Amphibalanus amphitrite]|uniref:protein phosphatase 1 regulatory subunit 3C-like isoform X1 n=1 Tax=Amphibalanus amphitrite TaxID=1232801 RepID=UPI001C9229C7|nr:protein phosphatase 1 regulatory subunit 3C-like isoform X1 [Amphibalanus amphitrite]XP_043193963.1 protein phosphatase 1 regulatory subunit 3C-like isoform X1 [Amphibalanus amphitrite]